MTVYSDLVPLVKSLMTEFGQGEINLIQLTSSGTPDEPSVTETSQTLNGVVKGVSFKFVMDGFATYSDLEVTCAVVEGITPTLNDFIEIDGQRYKIIADMSSPAAGTRVAWKFIVRK